MKKSFLFSVVSLSIVMSGCSSAPKQVVEDDRLLASKDYQCSFKDTVFGEEADFVFTPEKLELKITTEKSGTNTIFLQEDNFISGGFSFIESKGKKSSEWGVAKIDFISFSQTPKISLKLKKASSEMTVAKNCITL